MENKYYRLQITSESDYDYTLDYLTTNKSNYKVEKNEDILTIILDFHNCNVSEFIKHLIQFFDLFTISTNKRELNDSFEFKRKLLVNQLNCGILKSPDNWFSGNQDLMINFLEITENQL